MKDISEMIEDVKVNFRVGALIKHNGKILLEKGETESWAVIPGGRIKTMEDTKQALIREISEELHLDISNEEMTLQNVIENFFIFNNTKYHEMYFVYRVDLKEDNELFKRPKEELVNYDDDENYYEFVDIESIKEGDVKPYVLMDIFKNEEFKRYVVRDNV